MFDADRSGACPRVTTRQAVPPSRASTLAHARAPPPPRLRLAAGTLGYPEFERLMGTLDSWRRIFETADRDRSGKLSVPEVIASIRTLGFALPEDTMVTMMMSYDDDRSGQLTYDEFIRLLAELSALTAQFRRFDTRSDGTATIRYADFLSLVFSTKA